MTNAIFSEKLCQTLQGMMIMVKIEFNFFFKWTWHRFLRFFLTVCTFYYPRLTWFLYDLAYSMNELRLAKIFRLSLQFHWYKLWHVFIWDKQGNVLSWKIRFSFIQLVVRMIEKGCFFPLAEEMQPILLYFPYSSQKSTS